MGTPSPTHLLQVSNSVFAKKRGIENFHLDRYNPEGTPPDTVRFLNIGDVKRKRLSVEAALATGGLMAHCGWGWICSLPPTLQHTWCPSGTCCRDKTSRFTQKDNTITPKKPSVVWGPDKHLLSFSNMKGKWQYMGFQLLMFLEVQGPVIAPDRLGFP